MRFSPHRVTLRQLQYLVAVADTRSFHRAAALCRVSQPSLSSQVGKAERALGAALFERERRPVLVTRAGEALTERARRVLLLADALEDAAARAADPLAGTLRLGVIPTISPYLVPEAAPRLRRAFPRLRLVWVEDRTPAIAAGLRAGALDGALVALEADLGEVEHEVVAWDPFVLAAPPGHPLVGRQRPLRQNELGAVDLLVLSEGHCLREQTLAACAGARHSSYGGTSLPTLVQMVASGVGVTLLPELALRLENRRQALRLRRFARPGPGRTLALVWRPGSAAAGALRPLAAVLRAHLALGRSAGRGAAPGR